MTVVDAELPPAGVLTPIATRPRTGDVWTHIRGAPISITDAKRLHDEGVLEMCQGISGDQFVQFVVVRKEKAKRRTFFTAPAVFTHIMTRRSK